MSCRIAVAILWLICINVVAAQPFVITHSDPANGSVIEGDPAVISFFFNKNLHFSTTFIPGFSFVEPRNALTVRGVLQDIDGQRRPRIARFTVEHRATTDFAWVVYGIERAGGEYLAEPFVLNYTTEATPGDRSLEGFVIRGSSPLFETPALHQQITAASYGRVDLTDIGATVGKQAQSQPIDPERRLATSTEMSRTVVLMLAGYSTNPDTWTVRAAAKVDADGTFQFSTLRPESLYPIAIRFRENDNHTIEAFGVHDPADRGVANAVDLSTGTHEPLVMRMYPFVSSTSGSAIDRAGRAAGDEAWTRMKLQVLSTNQADPATGEAGNWTIGYLDEEERYTTLLIDPLAVRHSIPTIPPPVTDRVDPATLLDSSILLARTEESGGAAFRAEHPGTTIRMRFGGTNETIRPDREVFWTVIYLAPSGAIHTFHLDPFDGSFLELIDTRIEEAPGRHEGLLSAYPNPTSDLVRVSFALPAGESAVMELFDMLGRKVRSDALDVSAGDHIIHTSGLSTGTYLLRMRQGTRFWQRTLTVMR